MSKSEEFAHREMNVPQKWSLWNILHLKLRNSLYSIETRIDPFNSYANVELFQFSSKSRYNVINFDKWGYNFLIE